MMTLYGLATWLYVLLTGGVALFQLALALGAPWGSVAMGGKYPGQFPPPLRVAAVVQMLLLLFFLAIGLSRAGIAFLGLQPMAAVGIWVVVGYGVLGSVMNLLTSSKWERRIWAPVVLLLLAASLVLALAP